MTNTGLQKSVKAVNTQSLEKQKAARRSEEDPGRVKSTPKRRTRSRPTQAKEI